jgi:hypothetical protein
LLTHILLNDPNNQELKEQFNTSPPWDDRARFSKAIGEFAEKMASYAGSVENAAEYGKQIASRLCPAMLPYELGTTALFDQTRFNGRLLTDDAMDVMLTLASGKPLADGVSPIQDGCNRTFRTMGHLIRRRNRAELSPRPVPPGNSFW